MRGGLGLFGRLPTQFGPPPTQLEPDHRDIGSSLQATNAVPPNLFESIRP